MHPSSISSSSSADARRARAFALRVAIFALPLVAIAGSGLAVLYAASDAWSMGRVLGFEQAALERGQQTLFQRTFVAEELRRYKLENALERQPSLLALGSSTVMQLRARHFGPHASEFYNAGGFIQHLGLLNESRALLESLPKLRLVLTAFDLWWFNGGWEQKNKFLSIEHLRETPAFNQDFRARIGAFPIVLEVFRKGGGLAAIRDRLSRWDRSEPDGLPGAYGIGLGARRGSGFRGEDGSYRYGEYLANRAQGGSYVPDREMLGRIESGERHMDYGSFLPDRLASMEAFLAWCNARDIVVAGYASPLAPEIRAALAKSENHPGLLADYRRELPAAFARAGMPYVDAVEIFGRDARSMVDSIHASEVVLAEVVLRLLEHPRMRAALPELDPAHLEALLADPGTTFAALAPEKP